MGNTIIGWTPGEYYYKVVNIHRNNLLNLESLTKKTALNIVQGIPVSDPNGIFSKLRFKRVKLKKRKETYKPMGQSTVGESPSTVRKE